MWSKNSLCSHNEFELSQERIKHEQSKGPDVRHHEQVERRQKAFEKQVNTLTGTIEETEDLLVLNTRDIADLRLHTQSEILNR